MEESRRDFIKKSMAAGIALPLLGTAALPVEAANSRRKPRKRSHRVLVIAFDGIRVDGLQQAHTPNIDFLIAGGSSSMTTRDVMPSITMPNFTSILTGSDPELTGVGDNKWLIDNHQLPPIVSDGDGYYPSVFKTLNENGVKTAFLWNWEPLINPFNRKYIDEKLYQPDDGYDKLYDRAFEFMSENRETPAFTFLYTVHTDHVGHACSWMSPEYIRAIEEGDAKVGELFGRMREAGIFDDTHIFFITDHGGHGKGHGKVCVEDMIVPWVVYGPGIRRGHVIGEDNFTRNTASTVLSLFGLEQPEAWTGFTPDIFTKR